MARAVADHRIKLPARAGIRREIAPDADRGVAMRQPGGSFQIVPGKRPAICIAGLSGIGIGRPRRHGRQAGERTFIFCGRGALDALRQRHLSIPIAPLRDIIVLHAIDGCVVPPAGAGEGADVGDMHRREFGRELNDDAAIVGQVHDQQILGRNLLPVGGRGGGDHLRRLGRPLHRHRPPRPLTLIGTGSEQEPGNNDANPQPHFHPLLVARSIRA